MNYMVNFGERSLLLKNILYFYGLLDKAQNSNDLKKKSYLKFFFKFNLLRLNFYVNLLWNYFLLNLNRYYYFTKFYYLKTIKIFCLRNFHLYLYLNSLDSNKDKLVRMQSRLNKLVLSKKRYRKLRNLKLKRVSLIFDDYTIPAQILSLRLNGVGLLNYNLYTSLIKLNSIHSLGISSPLFINVLNQNYLLSGYFTLKYNLYRKFNFPYNVYYSNYNEISLADIYLFLNKFIGIFTKSGKKVYGYKLIKLFALWSQKQNLNFFTLIRYFIFNYLPFVYLKSMSINRRRITKPTLLTKEKSFYLAIKWWYEAAIVRKERSLALGLFTELLALNNDKGLVVTKYNNLLLSTYNSRSDLKIVRNKYSSNKNLLENLSNRKSMNEYLYNNYSWSRVKNLFLKGQKLERNGLIQFNRYFRRLFIQKRKKIVKRI